MIQDLFEIQSAIHGFLGPETQQHLIHKVYIHPLPSLILPILRLPSQHSDVIHASFAERLTQIRTLRLPRNPLDIVVRITYENSPRDHRVR